MLNNISQYVYILFIHLSIDEHLVCSPLLPIVNNAAVNMRIQIPLFRTCFQVFFCIFVCFCREVGLLNQMVILFLNFCCIIFKGSVIVIMCFFGHPASIPISYSNSTVIWSITSSYGMQWSGTSVEGFVF